MNFNTDNPFPVSDGSKPLKDGRQERYCRLMAKGQMGMEECYTQAGFKPDRGNASRLTAKDNISARIDWLKVKSATAVTLSVSRKREILATIAESGEQETRDIIKAIEVDNVMAGHNKPQEVKLSGALSIAESLKSLMHGRNRDPKRTGGGS